MRKVAWTVGVAALSLTALTGCAGNSMVMKGQLDKSRDEQVAISRQKDELQNRANRLDRDNQDLVNQITQSKQRTKLVEDQLAVVREQLNASNAQFARVRDEKKTTEQKVQTLTASLQRQSGTSITPFLATKGPMTSPFSPTQPTTGSTPSILNLTASPSVHRQGQV